MALSPNTRGALLMAGSMTAFTLNDAFMKVLSGEVPLFQAIFMRSLAVVVLLFVLAWQQGVLRPQIRRSDWTLIALRTVAEIAAAFLFISAIFNMPIANAIAILQALPLTVTLAGALFLGETVGWRRITAILIGFLGVLLIVQPGAEGFSVYSIYVLGAVVGVTVRDLAARRMSAGLPSVTVALITVVAIGVASGLASLFTPWVPMTTHISATLAGAAFFIIGGYIFSVAAMRVGEIGVVAQFRYSSLLVALILGVVVFDEFPGALTLIGAAIVVGTGLFTLWRERNLSTPPR
jgi:S-adenosylmethionine uptake transporter